LALALAATVLLQGLVWKSIQPRPVLSVRALYPVFGMLQESSNLGACRMCSRVISMQI
jgi:hypothetical protein